MNVEDNIVTSPDGYKWFVGGSDTDDHLALGGHETMLEPILTNFGDKDKAFLNVGAHVGLWAVRMAKHFESVWAVECNSFTADKLTSNVGLNDLTNVFVVRKAFWDTTGEIVSLVDDNGKSTGGSTRAQYGEGELLAQTSTIDDFFNFPGSPTFSLITLDVEGAEARVLRGAKQTLTRDKPNLVIELHEGHPGTDYDLRQQVYDILDELGYDYASVDITGERLICTPGTLNEPETVKADLPSITDSGIVPTVHTRTGELIYG